MLIQLTGHETGLPCFIASEKILAFWSAVDPGGVTNVRLDDAQGSAFQVNGSPSDVAEAIKTQMSAAFRGHIQKVMHQAERTLNVPSDAKVKFCELVDNIDTIENFLDEESCGHGVFVPALERIRELLAELEPRD